MNADLENLVQARTADLTAANSRLLDEVRQREQAEAAVFSDVYFSTKVDVILPVHVTRSLKMSGQGNECELHAARQRVDLGLHVETGLDTGERGQGKRGRLAGSVGE